MNQAMNVPVPPEPSRDVERVVADVAEAARVAGVEPNLPRIREVVAAYDGFVHAPVEMRTTDLPLPRRDVSFRYVDFVRAHDPYEIALRSRLLPETSASVRDLIPQLMAQDFRLLGWGIDAAVTTGLEKVWPFYTAAYPVERLFALPSLAPAVREQALLLRAHGLTHFSIIAVDYAHATMNLYFMVRAPLSTTGVVEMLKAMGLRVPTGPELDYVAHGVAINITFDWTSTHVRRACLYVPAPGPSLLPGFLAPNLRDFAARAPFLAPTRSYIVGCTYLRDASFVKVETDYTGTMLLGVLMRCAGVPIAE
jgi:hypothetical protein